MQFIVEFSLNPDKAKTPPSAQIRNAESQAVRALYMDGLVRQVGFCPDGTFAFMHVEGHSFDEVAQKLGALPMVPNGYLKTPRVVPVGPYPGFAPHP